MLLSIWTEYYDFFRILIIVIGALFLAYFIFFRPKNHRNEVKIEYRERDNSVPKHLKEVDEGIDLLNDYINDDSNIDESVETSCDLAELPNDFETGENSNIYDSLVEDEDIEIEDYIPAGIEIIHDPDEEVEEEEKEVEPDRIQIFGNYDLRPDIDPEQQIDDIIEDVLKLSEQTPAAKGGKYHVLYHKKDKLWYIKREGEGVVGEPLQSQQEGIAFATILALKNETTIVVHDKDGRISKYKF